VKAKRGKHASPIKRTKSLGPAKDERKYLQEQLAATEYTARWHETRDTAAKALESIADGSRATFPTVAGDFTTVVRIPLVRAAGTRASARREGWSATQLHDQLPGGSDVPLTGKRRVLVRAYAWLVSDDDGDVYDPQWITLIPKAAPDANNLRQGFVNAEDWLDHYNMELQFQVASKLLVFTMIEVVFWTAGTSTPYL
jgi:hypothetical protein